ncbi:MarR family winged helix-turn-helix transcriptional regulator [Geodermatophilus sp. SYSU D00691]
MHGDATAVLDRILELVAVLEVDTREGLARDGLTPARAHLIWELQHRGPLPQRALAEALRVSPRNVTGLVDGLVESGFVTREPHPTDRRATLVSFTPHGAEVAARLEREHDEFARILFADLPADRFRAFADVLDHVLARLREHGVSLDAQAER